jgi:hypothetical protein
MKPSNTLFKLQPSTNSFKHEKTAAPAPKTDEGEQNISFFQRKDS